jgi:hypothetical protein
MLPLRLLLLCILIATSTVLHVLPLLLAAFIKAVLPFKRLRLACNALLTRLAESWIGVNNWMWNCFTHTRLYVQVDGELRPDGH